MPDGPLSPEKVTTRQMQVWWWKSMAGPATADPRASMVGGFRKGAGGRKLEEVSDGRAVQSRAEARPGG